MRPTTAGIPRWSPGRFLLVATFIVVAGAVLGVVLAELAGFLPQPWFFLSQLWTPWIVCAFFAGLLCRRVGGGAVAGLATLAAGLASYVAYKWTQYGYYSVRPLRDVWMYWAVFVCVLGPIAGATGALTRDRRPWVQAFAWAPPVAFAVVEASAIALDRLPFGSHTLALLDLGVAAALFLVGAVRSEPLRLLAASSILTLCGLAALPLVQRAVPVF